MSTRTRELTSDELAALADQRDFLLVSLEDLEREHTAGDVDEHDYEVLRDDYTTRAAKIIRAIEGHTARVPAGPPAPPRFKALATVGVVVVVALLAVWLVSRESDERKVGETATGDIRQSTLDKMEQAAALVQQGQLDDAIEVYDEVLADQPDNVEAMTYKGWLQFQSGEVAGVATMSEAALLDEEYPDVRYFLAVAFFRLGRADTALATLDTLDSLDPAAGLASASRELRASITSAADAGSTTPTSAG